MRACAAYSSRGRLTPIYGLDVARTSLRVDRVAVRQPDEDLTLILGGAGVHVMLIRLPDPLGEARPPKPELVSALCQAAALIPGVERVEATDAIGREGVALALFDEVDGARSEWIFGKQTFACLGERSLQVETKDGIKAGSLNGVTAILRVAVVDEAGKTA